MVRKTSDRTFHECTNCGECKGGGVEVVAVMVSQPDISLPRMVATLNRLTVETKEKITSAGIEQLFSRNTDECIKDLEVYKTSTMHVAKEGGYELYQDKVGDWQYRRLGGKKK